MTYLASGRTSGLGFDLFQTFENPFFPGGLPGPVSPVGPVGPMGPAASIFPTSLRWGDVAMISGSFQGISQGQIRVKFQGAPWQAPALLGPFSASVVVPDGSETGLCAVEVDGRQVFGANCVITPASTVGGQVMRPREHKAIESWKNYGEKTLEGIVDLATSPWFLLGAGALALWLWKGRR